VKYVCVLLLPLLLLLTVTASLPSLSITLSLGRDLSDWYLARTKKTSLKSAIHSSDADALYRTHADKDNWLFSVTCACCLYAFCLSVTLIYCNHTVQQKVEMGIILIIGRCLGYAIGSQPGSYSILAVIPNSTEDNEWSPFGSRLFTNWTYVLKRGSYLWVVWV